MNLRLLQAVIPGIILLVHVFFLSFFLFLRKKDFVPSALRAHQLNLVVIADFYHLRNTC